jgi:glycosyltransferase involved in cell wall biosynthesis
MKVLAAVVIPPHLRESGAVRAATSLSLGLAEHCDLDLAIMADREEEEHRGQARILRRRSRSPFGAVQSVLSNKVRSPFYRSDIPDLIARNRYDLVHIHNVMPALEMRRIARASRRQGMPYVVSAHGFVEASSRGEAYGLGMLERFAWKYLVARPLRDVVVGASRVLALSPADLPLLRGLGVEESSCVLVPNGVEFDYFSAAPAGEIDAVRAKFDLPKDSSSEATRCFFLANHTPNKGLHVLLEAFLQTNRPFVLVVGGDRRGYVDYDGFGKKSTPSRRFVFTGALERREVRALFHYSDLFVFPTLADTFPLVVLEAMAAGLPVLSTQVGGIPHQVTEETGLLVPAGEVTAFRTAFETLAADRAKMRSLGESGRARVQTRFTWGRSVAKALEVYRSVVGSERSSGPGEE